MYAVVPRNTKGLAQLSSEQVVTQLKNQRGKHHNHEALVQKPKAKARKE